MPADGFTQPPDDSALQDRADRLFLAVFALPPEQRTAHLEAATEGQPELRAAVLGLLAAHDEPLAMLRETDSGPAPGAMLMPMPRKPMPHKIGAFDVLGVLGEGGMGVVYRAQQQNPKRTVAIKMMRSVFASAEMRQRFVAEGQALGRLSHPGIAQILEAGTYEAQPEPMPFLVMELIDGVPLTTYADRERLELHARLELLARVCDAMQHAHEHGVIHRDLKPDNILVDSRGQPKVLDFGIARTDQNTITLKTLTGQVLGTLDYMSPEQVAGSPRQVTATSDVYALGVVGYELVCSVRPHDLGGLSFAESVALLQTAEPRRLSAFDTRLRGDVETVLHKALEKDPSRRYASAAALASDLRRILAHKPVLARPASAIYRARKFVRRHRSLVGGTTATFVAVLIGAFFSIQFAWQAQANARQLGRAAYSTVLANVDAALAEDRLAAAHVALDAPAALLTIGGWELAYARRRAGSLLRTVAAADAEPWMLAGSPARTQSLSWDNGRSVALASDSFGPAVAIVIDHSQVQALARSLPAKAIATAIAKASHREVVAVGTVKGRVNLFVGPMLRPDLVVPHSGVGGVGVGVANLALSAQGDLLAVAFADGSLILHDLLTDQHTRLEPANVGADARLAFDRDSRRLAVMARDRAVVEVYDVDRLLATPEVAVAELSATVAAPTRRAPHPSGNREAIGHDDGRITITANEKELLTLRGHTDAITHLVWSAGGSTLESYARDGTRRIWSAGERAMRARPPLAELPVPPTVAPQEPVVHPADLIAGIAGWHEPWGDMIGAGVGPGYQMNLYAGCPVFGPLSDVDKHPVSLNLRLSAVRCATRSIKLSESPRIVRDGARYTYHYGEVLRMHLEPTTDGLAVDFEVDASIPDAVAVQIWTIGWGQVPIVLSVRESSAELVLKGERLIQLRTTGNILQHGADIGIPLLPAGGVRGPRRAHMTLHGYEPPMGSHARSLAVRDPATGNWCVSWTRRMITRVARLSPEGQLLDLHQLNCFKEFRCALALMRRAGKFVFTSTRWSWLHVGCMDTATGAFGAIADLKVGPGYSERSGFAECEHGPGAVLVYQQNVNGGPQIEAVRCQFEPDGSMSFGQPVVVSEYRRCWGPSIAAVSRGGASYCVAYRCAGTNESCVRLLDAELKPIGPEVRIPNAIVMDQIGNGESILLQCHVNPGPAFVTDLLVPDLVGGSLRSTFRIGFAVNEERRSQDAARFVPWAGDATTSLARWQSNHNQAYNRLWVGVDGCIVDKHR